MSSIIYDQVGEFDRRLVPEDGACQSVFGQLAHPRSGLPRRGCDASLVGCLDVQSGQMAVARANSRWGHAGSPVLAGAPAPWHARPS